MTSIQQLVGCRRLALILFVLLGSGCGSLDGGAGTGTGTEGVGVNTELQALVSGQAGVTQEQAQSLLYQRFQEYLGRQSGLRTSALVAGGASDTLAEYAAKCDMATGIHVPAFNCDVGTEVPNQDFVGGTSTCNKPNVLNGQCDKGSKFQVLIQTPDAAAVAHCRKVGLPPAGSTYNDIAVIQYNKKNGALCFYQALSNLPGASVAAPSAGQDAWRWISPAGTEAIRCTGCHDNGGFIRSPYLTQLTVPPNVLPNSAAGFDNKSSPVKFVGNDYATNRTWSVTTAPASGDTGVACTTCHRLGVNNTSQAGTATTFAVTATASSQASKMPHSSTSPIWMRPGQITYVASAEATAMRFRSCGTGFWAGQSATFTNGTPVSGCAFTPLGSQWTGFSPGASVAVLAGPIL